MKIVNRSSTASVLVLIESGPAPRLFALDPFSLRERQARHYPGAGQAFARRRDGRARHARQFRPDVFQRGSTPSGMPILRRGLTVAGTEQCDAVVRL
jgi:hypothetical protein